MKRLELLYTVMMVAAGLLMSVSCVKEKIEPDQRISGDFVLDDSAEGRDRYISFDMGVYREMSASASYYFADGKLWNCSKSDFSSRRQTMYSLVGGELLLGGVSQGKISQTGDNLLIGSKKYKQLKGLEKQYFFTISLPEGTSKTVTYSSQSVSIPYAVVSPSPASHARPTVTCDASWVKNLNVSDNKINFNVEENNTGNSHSATLLLRLSWADDVRYTLTQARKPVQSLSLNKSSLTLSPGKSETLVATVNPTDASLQWVSSNSSVAAVNQSGMVTAVGNGTATITVRAQDGSGKYASCTVTVTTLVTGITLNKTSLTIVEGQTSTLSVSSITPDNASNKSVTWSSSNTGVATVDQNGKVTAVTKGTTTIKATAQDGSGKYGSCEVTVYSLVNLSSNGSANCYIVSSAGAYSFRTTKGNGSTSVGSVSSAVVLWESYGTSTTPSVGSIINNVSYSSNTITFFTPSSLKNGNAVIAAKDASGNILWSWHIWVCSGYNPSSSAQTYYNSAGKMMDRNLGATSATPGNVGALGLLYQWGRKDPFLGSSSISSNTKAASTLTWPSAVSSTSSNGTIEYAFKNPTTFINCNYRNYDWHYTGSSSTDNDRWKSTKTIYDPCPPGWKVPTGGSSGVWAKAANTSSSFSHTWNSTNKGMNFSGKFGSTGTIWYPAAGYLYYEYGGGLSNVGNYGRWWSCTPNGYYAYLLLLCNNGIVYPSVGDFRAYGCSVRCQKE